MAADGAAHFALSFAEQFIRALGPFAQQIVRAPGRLTLELVHDVLQVFHVDHDKPPLALEAQPTTVQGRCHRRLPIRRGAERAPPR